LESRVPAVVYYWAYPIDCEAVAQAETAWHRRWGTSFVKYFRRRRVPSQRQGIRAYRPDDLRQCVELVTQSSQSADLAYIWTEESLAHQFCESFAKTWVAFSGTAVEGFVNAYQIRLQGRHELRAALIDLAAGPRSVQIRLLNTALDELAAAGVQVALTSCLAGTDSVAMVASGWLPVIPGYRLIFFTSDRSLPLHEARSLRVQVR
jgi:hypothetical protein